MFGRKGRVRITDNSLYVEGDVDVDDDRSISVNICDQRKFKSGGFYPTAEQARNIEAKIRWDFVNKTIQNTLSLVEKEAKSGNNLASIQYHFNPEDYPSYLTQQETFEVKQILRKLGYDVSINYVSW